MRNVFHSFRSLAATIPISVAGILVGATRQSTGPASPELWREVEVIRTAHGVPHIRAENLRAAGYGLAWTQLEDHGPRAAIYVLNGRGERAKVHGHGAIDSDVFNRRARARTIQTYPRLDQETRDVYEGFAAGINRYVAFHPEEFPPYMPTNFTGYDVAARDVYLADVNDASGFLATLKLASTSAGDAARGLDDRDELGSRDGSNAWAFAPSRTISGRAILLRNPHLNWGAGYYEAHITVPGVIDFYGDFRVGGSFDLAGGFNRYLGWAVTTNTRDLDEVYAVDVDPTAPDHYLFDGASLPLIRELTTVEFRNGDGLSSETRESWFTALGPVVHRANGKIYVFKVAGDGQYRRGEQFLRMMRASSLAEWKDAMKIRAKRENNYVYADHTGNIYYVWNATLPLLPHAPGNTAAIPARMMRDVWTQYIPFDSLPQVLNPAGGYIHNENDSPHFTNVRGPIDLSNAYPNFETPRLGLRSQLAIELIGGDDKVSLEDVVRMKHSYRILLADRVKPDLLTAVKAANPTGDVAKALALVEGWDNTAAPDSRGAQLFEIWWQRYSRRVADTGPPQPLAASDVFSTVWSTAEPMGTPRGLADPARAAESFAWAVSETARLYGRWDVAWGDVHRVRRGHIDVPAGGCSLGCFRALGFTAAPDGKLVANFGDAWVLAVEFGDVPRAYSVLAYGESSKPESPWHASQAEMFAKGQMKRVAFTQQDVNANAVSRYRPGERR